ncbi:MAG: hypothetical protein DHS20C10_13620 [marine bacterium B5-7]|nr:MAG: hypothetical protein DHS20C10_13620 [marine bacterium B5-7]
MPTTTADLFLTLVHRQDNQTALLRSEMQAGFTAQDQKIDGLRVEMQAQGKELRAEMQAQRTEIKEGFERLASSIKDIDQKSEKRSDSAKNWAWGLFLTSGTAFSSLLYLIYDQQREHHESIHTLKHLHPELRPAPKKS